MYRSSILIMQSSSSSVKNVDERSSINEVIMLSFLGF